MTAGGCFLLLLILDILSRKFGVFKNGIIVPLFSGKLNEEKKENDIPSPYLAISKSKVQQFLGNANPLLSLRVKTEIFYLNKKNGKLYKILHCATDTTNSRDGIEVVVYCPADNEGVIYVREANEFYQKFIISPDVNQSHLKCTSLT
jgi:hypothetical protein